MKKINNKGFSVIEAFLIFIIIGFIVFVGWYVWNNGNKTNASKTSTVNPSIQGAATSPVKEKVYTIPNGYVIYENKELGFKFAYPKEYGSLSKQPDENNVQILKSQEPTKQYGPGIGGIFMVYSYPSINQEISGRKYGPMIQLQNGKWIVTEASELDVIENKAGDEYKDFDKQVAKSQSNNNLTVYTLKSGDEGTENVRLVFVSKGRLHELYIPSFSDGTYGGGEENSKDSYSQMLRNVTDSILLSD